MLQYNSYVMWMFLKLFSISPQNSLFNTQTTLCTKFSVRRAKADSYNLLLFVVCLNIQHFTFNKFYYDVEQYCVKNKDMKGSISCLRLSASTPYYAQKMLFQHLSTFWLFTDTGQKVPLSFSKFARKKNEVPACQSCKRR